MVAALVRSGKISSVLFIEPPLWNSHSRNHFAECSESWSIYADVKKKVTIFAPKFRVPGKKFGNLAFRLDEFIWRVELLLKKEKLSGGIVLLNNPAFHYWDFVKKVARKAKICVADLSDDFEELYKEKKMKETIKRRTVDMVEMSDVVFCVNDNVFRKYAKDHAAATVLSNATNMSELFGSDVIVPEVIKKLRQKFTHVLLCTGTVNESRIDVELVKRCSENIPETAFLFVGHIDTSLYLAWQELKNIFLHVPVTYRELYNYICSSDAGFVPFAVNKHTDGNDLLKIYDFIALGKPVVSTNIYSAQSLETQLAPLLKVARTSDDFVCALTGLDVLIKEVKAFAGTRVPVFRDKVSWRARCEFAWNFIESRRC